MIAVRQYSSGSEIIAARTALRKRLLSPQTRPTAKPVLTLVKTDVCASEPRVWREQHDSHVMAYLEWKGNEPLGFLKLRCREMDVCYTLMTGEVRTQEVVRVRDVLMLDIWKRYPEQSFRSIGRMFGRDATTVRHSLAKSGALADRLTPSASSEPIVATVKKMFAEGAYISEIAQAIGMSYTTAFNIIKANGWTREKQRTLKSHAETIRAMTKSGSTDKEISLAIGYSRSRVGEFIRKHGWRRQKTT